MPRAPSTYCKTDACARVRGHAAVDAAKSGLVEISADCVIQIPRDRDSRGILDNWRMFYTVQTKFNLADKLLTYGSFLFVTIELLLAFCDGLLVPRF
jgi:hypothetical protein